MPTSTSNVTGQSAAGVSLPSTTNASGMSAEQVSVIRIVPLSAMESNAEGVSSPQNPTASATEIVAGLISLPTLFSIEGRVEYFSSPQAPESAIEIIAESFKGVWLERAYTVGVPREPLSGLQVIHSSGPSP